MQYHQVGCPQGALCHKPTTGSASTRCIAETPLQGALQHDTEQHHQTLRTWYAVSTCLHDRGGLPRGPSHTLPTQAQVWSHGVLT